MLRMLVVAVLVASSASIAAQGPAPAPGCQNCGVASFVDIPKNGAVVESGGFFVAGWGLECVSGRGVDRVDVWYEVAPNKFEAAGGAGTHGNGDLRFELYRPDVLAQYTQACPATNGMAGWHFYFTKPLPQGTRKIVINVWRGPFMDKHERTITVK